MKNCMNCKIKKSDDCFKPKSSKCIDCYKEYQKNYRLKNKEKAVEYQKNYYLDNKEEILENSKNYYLNNKEKVSEYKSEYAIKNKEKLSEKGKEYYRTNKDILSLKNKEYSKKNKDELNKKRNERNKKNKIHLRVTEKRNSDPIFALSQNIRVYIRNSFKSKGYRKNTKTQVILGCTFHEFKIYIESKFEDWMNWENRGLYNGEINYGWDVDHIVPLSLAKTEEDIIKLNHYTNLQPLCSYTNRVLKKDRLDFIKT